MNVRVKRVYEEPSEEDGFRVLVGRMWPRGLSKQRAMVDQWLRDIAPSDALRKWFGHEPDKWKEFRERYFRELEVKTDLVKDLEHRAEQGRLTLLFAARDEKRNNAVALKEYFGSRSGSRRRAQVESL